MLLLVFSSGGFAETLASRSEFATTGSILANILFSSFCLSILCPCGFAMKIFTCGGFGAFWNQQGNGGFSAFSSNAGGSQQGIGGFSAFSGGYFVGDKEGDGRGVFMVARQWWPSEKKENERIGGEDG